MTDHKTSAHFDWDGLRDVVHDGTLHGDHRERWLAAVDNLEAVVEASRPFGEGGYGPQGRRLGLALRTAIGNLERSS